MRTARLGPDLRLVSKGLPDKKFVVFKSHNFFLLDLNLKATKVIQPESVECIHFIISKEHSVVTSGIPIRNMTLNHGADDTSLNCCLLISVLSRSSKIALYRVN